MMRAIQGATDCAGTSNVSPGKVLGLAYAGRKSCQPRPWPAISATPRIAAHFAPLALSLTASPSLLEWRWRRAWELGKPGRVGAMLKCQKCPKPATYHITE